MTAVDFAKVDSYLESHLDHYIAELSELCAQPSISAQGLGLEECAALLKNMLEKRGFTVSIIPTAGYPIVYAEAEGTGPGTLLFYNHYDVQPVEPLELWDSPPFEPTVRDGRLYGRGVSDDKGHIICRLAALDALRDATGSYPCRIKFVIEGEEEVSSVNLTPFVEAEAERLQADACVWEFGGVDHTGHPMQTLGMRGICYVQLSITTASQDAHSGLGGSIFPNAAWRLVWALGTLKDADEQVLIPGFYDDIVPPSERDLEMLAALPDSANALRERYQLSGFLNDMMGGVELKQAEVFQPTCTICGLTAGYQGPGSKTVLPAQAGAKVDFRLVPNQRPQDILAKLRKHLNAQGFSDIEVKLLGGTLPARTDPDHPFVQMSIAAARDTYGLEPRVAPMIGGSGPNHAFIEHLKVPIVTAGVGTPDAQIHAPNENMRLDLFVKGAQHTARIVAGFAAQYLRGRGATTAPHQPD